MLTIQWVDKKFKYIFESCFTKVYDAVLLYLNHHNRICCPFVINQSLLILCCTFTLHEFMFLLPNSQLLIKQPPSLMFSPKRNECAELNWAAPSDTFRRFTSLLKQPVYTYNVLLGLTVSVGGLTESLVSTWIRTLFKHVRVCRCQKRMERERRLHNIHCLDVHYNKLIDSSCRNFTFLLALFHGESSFKE